MKEYILTFTKGTDQFTIRRYLAPKIAMMSIIWAEQKKTDKKGVQLISCVELNGITAKDFIPSILD